MALGGLLLGSPILYLKGMGMLMFQLSGFYYRALGHYMFPLLGLRGSYLLFFKPLKEISPSPGALETPNPEPLLWLTLSPNPKP